MLCLLCWYKLITALFTHNNNYGIFLKLRSIMISHIKSRDDSCFVDSENRFSCYLEMKVTIKFVKLASLIIKPNPKSE